jgi:Cdc6-like AAA superfamily ATPase
MQNSNTPSISADDLLQKFSESKDKNETVEVLRELFDSNNKLKMISDLTPDAINLIVAINTIGDSKGLNIFNKITNSFMELQISKKRMSRKETIEAIKGYVANKNMNEKIKDVFR